MVENVRKTNFKNSGRAVVRKWQSIRHILKLNSLQTKEIKMIVI
jgi:hypothetical protein